MSSKYCCTRTDCVYHPHKGPDEGTCDYMVITRKRRGCPIVGCTRYRSGKRQRTGTGIQPILDPVEKKAAEEAKKKAQAIFGENLKAAIAKKIQKPAAVCHSRGDRFYEYKPLLQRKSNTEEKTDGEAVRAAGSDRGRAERRRWLDMIQKYVTNAGEDLVVKGGAE